LREVDGYAYFECMACGSLHADPDLLRMMDAGQSPVGKYENDYWEQERIAAVERAAGLALCRVGEAILYARRPVNRFLDVGAGPGFLLENLQTMLDPEGKIFHAAEQFPPPYAVSNPNYHRNGLASLEPGFDAGVCIEVVEHLTPAMLRGLLSALSGIAAPGSFWLFNTGMPDYVKNEDPGYLDPLRRGHVVSYSLQAIRLIFSEFGFIANELPGKSFAFYAEYKDSNDLSFDSRIYQALPDNIALLKRNELLFHAAFEAARAYLYYDGYLKRTAWASSLNDALKAVDAVGFRKWIRKLRR
jgi:hypothetical protein